MSELDPYFYSRDHDAGPGAWCVRGPDNFKMAHDRLTKDQAYAIGKVLSRKYGEALSMIVLLDKLNAPSEGGAR